MIRVPSLRAAASILAALSTLAIASCANTMRERDSSIASRKLIEGVYVLVEAYIGDEIIRPPRVDGRFVLKNGVVVTVLHYRLTDAEQSSTTSFGRYVLDENHFSYRYDDAMVVNKSQGSTTISRTPPWEGMRTFQIGKEHQGFRLQTEHAMQELLFTTDGLTYSENGRIQRVWRRTAEIQK